MADLEQTRKALALALCRLIHFEPGDSRAVSDGFVAMFSVLVGDTRPEVMSIIDRELAIEERESQED